MTVWTNWDPLEEVIVGDCYSPGALDWSISPELQQAFNHVLEETKQDLDNLATLLTDLGVVVHRPRLYSYQHPVDLSSFSVDAPMAPIVPRDQYLVYGNTVYQTFTSMTDRFFDSRSYYDIFRTLFERGSNWISQPMPNLWPMSDSRKWMDNYQDLGRMVYHRLYAKHILWHTATMFKCGEHLITNTQGPGSQLGLAWMQRNLPVNTIVSADSDAQQNWGHIDHGFFMTDDDTVFCVDRSFVPRVLQNKTIHEIKLYFPPRKKQRVIQNFENLLDESKGYEQVVSFDTNVLVVDPHNVIFTTHNTKLFKLLDSLGVNSHVCPIRHGVFWEAGIHCLTLDIKRKGQSRTVV
jgi:glycine amidinotransferase/scyllo-inosamine-4-phosphate amidinotransferase 1